MAERGRSLRLLSVTHFFEAHGGGIERVAGALNRALAELGHSTAWAASDADAAPGADTATAVPLRCVDPLERATGLPMPLPLPSGLFRLWRAVGRADAVIVHDALYASSIAALLMAKLRRRPVLLIQHIATIPFSDRARRAAMALADRLVTRPMLRAADRALFISEAVRDAFADVRFRNPPRIVFNGVDPIFRPGDAAQRFQVRAALGFRGDERVALFVGRFVEKKGLAAIERVARARPGWRFVLAGRGPIDPDGWRLPNVATERGRAGATLASLYRAADLLLLPSVGEGYPLVIQEAIACGLPVVCGLDSIRADRRAARWMTPVDASLEDPEGTAAAVCAALDAYVPDIEACRAMADFAASTYRWPAVAAVVAESAAEALARSGAADRSHALPT